MLTNWFATGRESAGAPRLAQLMATSDLRSIDENSYTAATSLVEFLISKGDEEKLLLFAVEGQHSGWETALKTHYRINSFADLQFRWQAWIASK